MRLPRILARLAFPWVASKTAVAREWDAGFDGRRALEEWRRSGDATEWEIRIVASALAKVRGLEFAEAMARARFGAALGFAEGSLPLKPTRADLLRVIWRADSIVEARMRK